MLIERPPKWFRLLFRGVIFRMEERGCKKVYLTFDDGPIPEATPWVLDTLDKFGVKATFFMVGENARRHYNILKDVKARGHVIGNHTFHHIRGGNIRPAAYIREVEDCQELKESDLFRPPHGMITPGQLKALKKRYRVVMFDLVTRDYSKKVSAEGVVRNVKKYARNGSIIVFHDSVKSIDKLKTALPESISWLKAEGYEFGVL